MSQQIADRPHLRPTPTVEDYLGAIYTMERDGETVIGARLSEWLEVSPPTVTATVKRMIRDGWVTMDRRKEIHLTSSGRQAAVSVLRRHMLSELLLAHHLGVPWSRVHQEADEMEHIISRDTMERMQDRLEDPRTCPHGNPLPGHEELMANWVALTEIESGQKVVIQRVHESLEQRPEVMVFLEAHDLVPGVEATVEEVIPFNETMSLLVGDKLIVLGFAVARGIFVESSP
jgi:DtxR family Mn-dependent transcriptional regulator